MNDHKSFTVLILEDDASVATLERRRLERAGYGVLTAATTDQALQKLRQHPVSLILLDGRSPGEMDGLELYNQVRAAGFDLPVILATGFGNDATVIKALGIGGSDFVTTAHAYLDYLPEAVAHVLNQVQTEHDLVESEARLASVINSAKDAIIVAESDQRIVLFNAAAEAMFRCRSGEAIGQPLSRFIPREHHVERAPDGLQGSRALSQHIRYGNRGMRADGDLFPLEASYSRVSIGGRTCYTIVVRDISERQRAEQALKDSEERYRSLVQTAGSVILCLSPDGHILEWNHEAERIYDFKRHEVLGKSYLELCVPAAARERVAASIRSACAGVPVRGFENSAQTRHGTERILVWNFTRLSTAQPDRPTIIAVGQDITEYRKLEEQFRQAQKMEAVGRLAGGVAHDFNNVLTVIMGYAELLLSQMVKDHDRRGLITEIKKAGERAAAVTNQLLAFSRKQVLDFRVLDLNHVVAGFEKMICRLIGEDIDLKLALSPGVRKVKADPGQLEQVLMNLIVNARDAMERGGKLTIETRNVDLDEAYVRGHWQVKPGRYALLAVSDSGHGMSGATLARIFEPFFTTKEPGKGTGLGLSTVYGIVKQSGGYLDVYSEVGVGTTFKIYLPESRDTAPLPRSSAPATFPAHGTETLLLAEDEEQIRALAKLVLQSRGYSVLAVGSGTEAVEQCRTHAGRIHLMLTDVVMPGMSGRSLKDTLRAVRPDMKILFMSGYTDDTILHHGVLDAGVPFLQKPFTPQALLQKVRDVLDA